jgi:hypothetical protein
MDPILSALALAGTFVASAFALVRFTLRENRCITDRFTGFLEGAVTRQEATNKSFREVLEKLVATVDDNSSVLTRILDQVAK